MIDRRARARNSKQTQNPQYIANYLIGRLVRFLALVTVAPFAAIPSIRAAIRAPPNSHTIGTNASSPFEALRRAGLKQHVKNVGAIEQFKKKGSKIASASITSAEIGRAHVTS